MKALVTGAGGMLARSVVEVLARSGHDVVPLSRAELDVTDGARVLDVIASERPDVVVQCAAYTRVDEAEVDEAAALRVNRDGARNVALACRALGARLVYPSTDYVFDGASVTPYPPEARTAPLNAYGRTKLAGEAACREAGDWLIVRTAWLYGHGGAHFIRSIVSAARAGKPLRVVADQHGSPTWTADLAERIHALLVTPVHAGTWHVTSAGHTTWYGLATLALELAGIATQVEPLSSAEWSRGAPRPHFSVLDCTATDALIGPAPVWSEAVRRAMAAGVHEP